MIRIIAVLAMCASCVAWSSRLTVGEQRHVLVDSTASECARTCRPNDGRCLASCPGAAVGPGDCGDREPGTCFGFVATSEIERDGRCYNVGASVEATGAQASACTEEKHITAIGVVGGVLAGAALVLLLAMGAVPL